MKRIVLCLMAMALSAAVALGQCPSGQCPYTARQPAPSVDVKVKVRAAPTAAWRYANPTGYKSAVVRVFCQDGVRTRSIGSGVIVRWGKRIVVLTARHVVQDAKSVVIETFRKQTYRVKIIKVDAIWDCAVLKLTERPEGVEPAEVELGSAAMFSDGDRLESCGYGPDGKLACNFGLFKGYRRSSRDPTKGPDDWMVTSGHARSGDSGGPVFNKRGRVVGVLWGTDGETVVSVQAGRVHVLLDDAMRVYVERAVTVGIFNRSPTPPKMGPLVPVPQPSDGSGFQGGCGDGSGCPGGQCDPTRDANKAPILPWRGDSEARDSDFDNRLNGLLAAQEAERQARINAQRGDTSVDVQVGPKPDTPQDAGLEPKPIGIVLCLVGAGVAGIVIFYIVGKN